MTEPFIRRACPYLGLPRDPSSHFVSPDEAHVCCSPGMQKEIDLEHQVAFCFSSNHNACSRFVDFGLKPERSKFGSRSFYRPELTKRFVLVAGLIGLSLLMVFAIAYFVLIDSPLVLQPTPVDVASVTTSTPVAKALTTAPATLSVSTVFSQTRTPARLATSRPLEIPSPPSNGTTLILTADENISGWISNKDAALHLGERDFFVGIFQKQTYVGILQFDLTSLPPGSKILFATLELVGRNGSRLASDGEWQFELIDARRAGDLTTASYDKITSLPSVGSIGQRLKFADLAAGNVNRLALDAAQRQLLENQISLGEAIFRVKGPTSQDNLFAWDSGGGVSNPPTLYLVAVPASFVVITSTPTPANVITAAAMIARQTADARERGTPTPGRSIFATPTIEDKVIVTAVPTAANAATAIARSVFATAVAMTTGTLTPTPLNYITATPQPLLIPIEQLTPVPTPTPTQVNLTSAELARKPIPAELYNKIVFLEGPRSNPKVWAMDPDGTHVALLTNREVYDIVQARDTISPDGGMLLYNDPYPIGGLQLWGLDLNYPTQPARLMTRNRGKLVFAPAWSPDGKKIAYVSDEGGPQDIWIHTLQPQAWDRITFANGKDWFWTQYPSWSSDSKRIVVSSDRGHAALFSEIWVMNADGSDMRKLGNNIWDAYAPTWIKWQK